VRMNVDQCIRGSVEPPMLHAMGKALPLHMSKSRVVLEMDFYYKASPPGSLEMECNRGY
jgi:hypothetical protein